MATNSSWTKRFLYSESIDLTSYSRQRDKLREELTFAKIAPASLVSVVVAKLEDQAVRDEFVDRPPPPGSPGAYNRFWVDARTKVVAISR